VLRIMARPTDREGRILYIAAPDAGTATDWTTKLYSDRPEVRDKPCNCAPHSPPPPLPPPLTDCRCWRRRSA